MSTNPDYLTQLIDSASQAAGSDNKLAILLKQNRSAISQWRSGRACPIGDQVLMAEIAGLKSEEWAARAIVSQYEGTAKGDMLYRALRKSLPAIGAAIATSGAHASAIFSTPMAEKVRGLLYTMYRLVKLKPTSLQLATYSM